MTTQYQLRVYDRGGTLTNIITDMRGLSYVKEVNAPGMLSFDLPGKHQGIANLVLDAQVEVWRQNLDRGFGWYCDFYAFWRGDERTSDNDGVTTYRAICPGQMDLLARRVVAYPANTANRSQFTAAKAETVAKTLVKYNSTASGTTGDGRARNVGLTPGVALSVEVDGGRGNTIDFACSWRRLLDALRDVAAVGGGDFDLPKTDLNVWTFTWYPGQRGTDRTASVVFSLDWGNITNPKLTRSYVTDKTVAIVGGQGQDNSRTIAVRTSSTNYVDGYRDYEFFVDARNVTTTSGLNAAGDAELYNQRAQYELAFNVLQTPTTAYGASYFLGDLVTTRYEDVVATKKIQRVTVSVQESGTESIKVELTD